jgi:hypothetical protein
MQLSIDDIKGDILLFKGKINRLPNDPYLWSLVHLRLSHRTPDTSSRYEYIYMQRRARVRDGARRVSNLMVITLKFETESDFHTCLNYAYDA